MGVFCRLYQNNNAQLDCPISSAKADLNIDKVDLSDESRNDKKSVQELLKQKIPRKKRAKSPTLKDY